MLSQHCSYFIYCSHKIKDIAFLITNSSTIVNLLLLTKVYSYEMIKGGTFKSQVS
jgi:hypothetical protein